jgi:small subunit ribosomal protein S16
MAVHIRLARHGSKKSPFYRIVVTDQRNARDGRFIESLGTWNPNAVSGEGVLEVNRERIEHWKKQGAHASHTLDRLLKKQAGGEQAAAS